MQAALFDSEFSIQSRAACRKTSAPPVARRTAQRKSRQRREASPPTLTPSLTTRRSPTRVIRWWLFLAPFSFIWRIPIGAGANRAKLFPPPPRTEQRHERRRQRGYALCRAEQRAGAGRVELDRLHHL
jgi:hypothetical protein